MAITLDDVLPASTPGAPGAVPPPAVDPAAPAPVASGDDGEATIPDAVLEIPEFSGLLEGKPAAVYVEKGVKTPETEVIMANMEPLANAGFGFYPSKDGVTAVVFNTQYISGEEIQKADEEGRLAEVAVPFEELKASFDSALGRQAAPAGAEAVPAPAPAQAAVPPQSASANNKVAQARLKNVAAQSPTAGPTPGQGRILSNIVKPVI